MAHHARQGRFTICRGAARHAATECAKAMAVHFGVDIVSIEGRRFYDGCNVYAADAARMTERSVSWRETLVPRLQRQQAGQRLPTERPLIVIVWNGVNHFDAAVPAIGRHGRVAPASVFEMRPKRPTCQRIIARGEVQQTWNLSSRRAALGLS